MRWISRVLASSGGPLPADTLRLIFRELMSGSPIAAASAPRRLPGAEIRATATWPRSPSLARPSSTSRSARSRRCSRRSTAGTYGPASCPWRIRPTAGSPTRWRCSSACRASRSAPRSGFGVHHCLLGRCEWGQVRRVYSKAQALSPVPALAGQEPAAGDGAHALVSFGRRGRAGATRGVRGRRGQPGRRERRSDSTCWPPTSRTIRTT